MGMKVTPPNASLARSDSNTYTLTNGRSNSMTNPSSGGGGGGAVGGRQGGSSNLVRIQDSRWRFQEDGALPKPREWRPTGKNYRAGRVSSVPLDLAAYD